MYDMDCRELRVDDLKWQSRRGGARFKNPIETDSTLVSCDVTFESWGNEITRLLKGA